MKVKQDNKPTILLAEADVIVRLVLAERLRQCAVVLEAASAQEARAILAAGPKINLLLADAQLAGGDDTGFALASWIRRYRPQVEVVLTASIAHKAEAATEFCSRDPEAAKFADTAALTQKIRAMMAERKRRTRPSAPTAPAGLRRRR